MSPATAAVATLSWPEVETQLAAGAVGVLPIGAGAKEHGAHLPMNSDLLQAEYLAARLAAVRYVLIWPALSYGHYPAFLEYPGSCSVSYDTFRDTVRGIIGDIARAGAREVLILNTGISTIGPLEEAVSSPPDRHRYKLAHVYRGERYATQAKKLQREARGGHAGEMETSIMLALAPEYVHLERARPWDVATMRPGPLRRTDSNHPNYSPQGIYGDPTVASAEKGRRLLQAMLDDLLALL